ncbi:MAG TPA: hypothetical protein VFP20_00390 [Bacteroidales bacterium]|nr:hypothetical protein [Bacteroidales bacterium]
MKFVLLLFIILTPNFLFAQEDSISTWSNVEPYSVEPAQDEAAELTWKDRREPILAGFLSYLLPGSGQIYNREYEKALGVASVMAYSMVMLYQSAEVNNETMAMLSGAGLATAYVYSVIDAITSAKRINKSIELRLGRNTSMSLKPDLRFAKTNPIFGGNGFESILGLSLKLSL